MRSSSGWLGSAHGAAGPSSQRGTPQNSTPRVPRNPDSRHGCNVIQLLARREVCSRTNRQAKKIWADDSTCCADSFTLKCEVARDARTDLISWIESESLRHLSGKYCSLLPPPRSTIAAAFSLDGRTLASTHGDHTVKIIDWQTGKCLKVLSGHQRTPWVVRFHPLRHEVLASGSLDHEVRLWNAKTSECIGSRDFYRPIASIAFHAQGEILAIASGHKLYIWHYNRTGEASSPAIILKTRRSLRAVHFHPNAPLLLTAEVNDLDASDSSMVLATSPGYLRYPPPTVYLADSSSNNVQHRVDPSASVRLLTYSTPSGQYELLLSPIESISSPVEESHTNPSTRETERLVAQSVDDAMETDMQPDGRSSQFFPFSDPAYWELPFLQGWLIGQSQANQRTVHSQSGGTAQNLPSNGEREYSVHPVALQSTPGSSRRSRSRLRSSVPRTVPASENSDGAALNNTGQDAGNSQPFMSWIQSEVASSLSAAAAGELPCTVKLRIWPYDIDNPAEPLVPERCLLNIPHAVLCSEMGAHFSPCGKFLAACVACILPNMEVDPGFHGHVHHDTIGAATSPTRHPALAHQVMYELRIYSLEEATFGSVLASRAIRAAHCLTSIQFSPTSEHLLLAYGRRHGSLLKSVLIDGEITVPIYTIMEVYRVSDMELVRVLPSAEDEVNVACFHPSAGGGLVYGTKEGKLRILQFDNSGMNHSASSIPEENMFEVPTYALEG